MRKKLLTLALALITFALPTKAIVNGRSLTNTLKDLSEELQTAYLQSSESQTLFNVNYERQHQRMISVIKESNELSLLLYTQELDMTFDMAYALKKVTSDYKSFSKDRRPYDRIVGDLNYEIERYARLIEALRRLPPTMRDLDVQIVPDSLLYHNDSLDLHILNMSSSLEREVIEFAAEDSLDDTPFVLDEAGETYRDTCFMYAVTIPASVITAGRIGHRINPKGENVRSQFVRCFSSQLFWCHIDDKYNKKRLTVKVSLYWN